MTRKAIQGKTVILGAFRTEVEQLYMRLQDASGLRSKGPLKYVTGKLGDSGILVGTMGIGKVRAAAAAQAAIHIFQPQRIIVCGTAGSLAPEVGALDLVVARDLLQYDTGPSEPKPIATAPELFESLCGAARATIDSNSESPQFDAGRVELSDADKSGADESAADHAGAVHTGTLITGDKPVIEAEFREALYQKYNAKAVDMEAAAVAAVCELNAIPMGVAKAITDTADEGVEKDFKKNVKESAARAQQVVLSLFDV